MPNSRTPRIIGRIIRTGIGFLVFSVCAILLIRVCSSGDPKSMNTLLPNAPLAEAYEEYGDDLILQYQKQDTITREEHNAGYFSVTQYVFIPQAEQLQLVFRYNNSTLEYLKEDKGLATVPDKSEHLFDLTVVVKTLEDGKECVTRYNSTMFQRDTASKKLYTYYRYVFDGIKVTDEVLEVSVEVRYIYDVTDTAYGSLCLYDTDHKWFLQNMSRADEKAIEAWIEQHR